MKKNIKSSKFSTKETSILSYSDLRTVKGKIVYWTFFVALCVVALFSLLPAIWTVLTAFKDSQEIFSSASFFPKDMSWNRFVTRISESWTYLRFGEIFLNTIILLVEEWFFGLATVSLGGYALSKLNPKGGKLIFALIVWTMMMPGQIRTVPVYISNMHFPFGLDFGVGINLLDTYWPLVLGAGGDAFSVLLFKNAFDGVSNSYMEAARIDGCSDFKIFIKIMIPLVMPVIIYKSIGSVTMILSNFFGPLLYLDTKEVLPLTIYRLKMDPRLPMNTYFMALVFASIPSFLIYAIFQKRIMGGINVGGVKG